MLAAVAAFLLVLVAAYLYGQSNTVAEVDNQKNVVVKQKTQEKMKVEIWSDIMCPLVHLGGNAHINFIS